MDQSQALNLRARSDGDTDFSNPDNDPNGPWRLQQIHGNTRGGRWVDSLYYSIVNPLTGEEHFPPTNRNWVHSRERIAEMIATGEVIFGRDGLSAPQRKRYLRDVRPGLTWPTIWRTDNHGKFPTNRNASAELAQIFGGPSEFDTPKPVGLIDRILRIATGPDDIVLDSFAGSGATAHAVLALNKEDEGNRKFILIECEDYADTITAERVRRVINGIPDASDASLREGLGDSFTYGTLGKPFEIEGMLTGDALPSYESLAAHLLHIASGVSVGADVLEQKNDDGLFHSGDGIDYYLLYKPDLEYLRSNEAILNLERAQRIRDVNHQNGVKAIVYAPGKYIGQRELTGMGITFCQLPHALHER